MTVASSIPGLVIAAPRSGAGKTTVTLGLMRALTRRGVKVQPFKCGPDYIDPAFHSIATGRPSFNLDTWAMSVAAIQSLISSASGDLAVVEGVMGLFDGVAVPGMSGHGATADIAALSGWPVVLVLDCSGQSETAAAVALGLARYRTDVEIAGVILNNIASARHRALIEPALERIGMPVFGVLMRNASLEFPERHLGLVQALETGAIESRLDTLADQAEASFDLARIMALANSGRWKPHRVSECKALLRPTGQRIAIARDVAFSFLYPHLAEGWRRQGASLHFFSPLADEVPDASADAIWLPGGYPELHAGRIAAAGRFKRIMRDASARGVTIHGECGGFMVLGDSLIDAQGSAHEMLGLLAIETSFARRKLHLGYRRAVLSADCALGSQGDEIRGHEFHYASLVQSREEPLVVCSDANGAAVSEKGARRGRVSGTFFHAIFGNSG